METLQDQAQIMLAQHIRAKHSSHPVRSVSVCGVHKRTAEFTEILMSCACKNNSSPFVSTYAFTAKSCCDFADLGGCC